MDSSYPDVRAVCPASDTLVGDRAPVGLAHFEEGIFGRNNIPEYASPTPRPQSLRLGLSAF